MSWPRDDAKLDRVRGLMAERDLDALVVRAPDNVLYLTDYRCMKGYDLAVFPREGEPALVVLEPQAAEAGRSWAGAFLSLLPMMKSAGKSPLPGVKVTNSSTKRLRIASVRGVGSGNFFLSSPP